MVTDLDTDARADLVLPLAGHDLGVGASDLNASVQASLVMHVGNNPAEVQVAAD